MQTGASSEVRWISAREGAGSVTGSEARRGRCQWAINRVAARWGAPADVARSRS